MTVSDPNFAWLVRDSVGDAIVAASLIIAGLAGKRNKKDDGRLTS